MIGLLVALAGGLGATARFALDAAITRRNPTRFPLGTLLINVTGSFLLGLLVGWASGHTAGDLVAIAGTGFLGGYTTFSTASVEAFRLVRTERRLAAVAHAGGMLIASVLAAGLGLWVAAG
ncbi:MAG: fluoride efflux transporter FluC [Actinomycetota bacterium]